MKKLLFSSLVVITTLSHANAQSLGCSGAMNLNILPQFVAGATPYDPTISYGCVNTSTQHYWYGYFKVCTGGTLDIQGVTINSGDDISMVAWGPFASATNICSNLTTPNIAGCAATSTPYEQFTLGTVNAGDYSWCVLQATVSAQQTLSTSLEPRLSIFPVGLHRDVFLLQVMKVLA